MKHLSEHLFSPAPGEPAPAAKARIERNAKLFREVFNNEPGRRLIGLLRNHGDPIQPRFLGRTTDPIAAAMMDERCSIVAMFIMHGTDSNYLPPKEGAPVFREQEDE